MTLALNGTIALPDTNTYRYDSFSLLNEINSLDLCIQWRIFFWGGGEGCTDADCF